MRRPPKPFVTEYKTSNRRSPPAFNEPAGLAPAKSPKVSDVSYKLADVFAKPDPDDSYDAAMRAADALFSIPSHRPPTPASETRTPGPVGSPEGPRSAHSAADSVFQRRLDTPPAEASGRILRALDEAPPPEYAALEAEYAPKRRGRKPGSKNRPKIADPRAPVADQTPSDRSTGLKRRDEPDASPAPSPSVAVASVRPAVRRIAALAAAPRAARVPASPPAMALSEEAAPATIAPRADKRRGWMRRPKPGEDWKRRRLPKVCW